jgi:hypothetical protein
MHARTATAAIAAALLLTTLSACSGDDKPKASADPAPATSSAFLRPTSAQEGKLINGLTDIDPALSAKEDRAISRSVDVCNDIRTGKDNATVLKNAAFRYTGGDVTVDISEAAKIVKAIKAAYCKA